MKKLEFAKLLELAIDECINITNMAKEKGEELFNSINDGLDDNPEYKYYLYLKKLSYSKMERLYLMLSVPTYSRVNSMDASSVLEYQKEKEDELKVDASKLQDPDYIARYAREKYSYSKDGEIILRIP